MADGDTIDLIDDKDVHVIFPVLDSPHFYIVSFNFKAKLFHIIDHIETGVSIEDTYGVIPLNLVRLFVSNFNP